MDYSNMSSQLRCKLCCKLNATVYSLCGTSKTPLCHEDMPVFISSQESPSSQVVFPIESFSFVKTADDFKLYQIRQLEMNKALAYVDNIIEKVNEESEELSTTLEVYKKAAVDALLEEFESVSDQCRAFQEKLQSTFTFTRTQFQTGKESKDIRFSRISRLIQKRSEESSEVPNVIAGCVRDVLSEIRKAVQSALATETQNPDEYLAVIFDEEVEEKTEENTEVTVSKNGVQSQTSLNKALLANNPYKQNGPTRTYPGSSYAAPVAKRPKVSQPKLPQSMVSLPRNCALCQCSLDSDNFSLAEGHEHCFVCFECINKATKTYVKCPICKKRFTTQYKIMLEEKIPGLIKIQSKKRTRRHGNLSGSMALTDCCVECGEQDLTVAHKCPNDELICLKCCQHYVINNRQPRPGNCPKCGMWFSSEIFAQFNQGKHGCFGCGKILTLANVGTWVETDGQYRYFCLQCQSQVSVDNWVGGN